MKKLLLLILFSILLKGLDAQNIVGRWQASSAVISDESDENYQFFTDGTFCFNLAGDVQLAKVLKIGGTYKIINTNIIFTPTYYIEETGGYLTRTGAEPGTAQWSFVDTKENKVQLEKIIKQELPFKLYKSKNNTVLEIDFNKFYKIQSNPLKYH